MFAVGADVGATAGYVQVEHARAAGFDGQDRVSVAHPAVDRGQKPLAVRRPAEVVEVVEVFVGVLLDGLGCQIVDENSPGGKILDRKSVELAAQVGDTLRVRFPAGLPGVFGN